jgi:hypothetical protein
MPIATNPQTGETVFLTDDGQWAAAQTAVNPQTKEMVAYDGKNWVPVKMPERSLGRMADDAVRSIASGATLGFADEIAAGADALIGRGSYDRNLAREQARDAQIPASTKIPGEIAGGIGATVATAPLTGPAAVATGLSRLPAAVRYPATGTVAGGLYGAGEAKPGERMEGAGKGAAFGLGAGVVVPPSVAALGKLGSELRGAVMPSANVATDLGRAIKRDETTPDALIAATRQLQQTRPGVATLADAGGENVRGLVERVAQTPGAGRTTVVPFLNERQKGQMMRLSGDLKGLTGTSKSATEAINETMTQRKRDASPLYKEAFDFNAREHPEIVRAWTEITSTGYGRSFMMRPDFRKTLQTEYGISNPADAPLMVQIDVWKKVADDFVKDNLGKNNARVVQGMRNQFLEIVDKANPKYAEARNAWAGPSEYLNAIEEGRNILSTKVSGEQLAAGLQGMTDAQREAYRIGAVSAIVSKMGNDPARMADMTKYLRSPENRAKVAALMPTPEARQAWAERLDFEVSSSELTGRALGNSATARRLAERQDADSIVGDLVMDAIGGTAPVGLVRRMLGAVPKAMRDTLRSRSDAVLAELLTDPEAFKGLVKALERVKSQGNPPSIMRRNAATVGTVSGLVNGE